MQLSVCSVPISMVDCRLVTDLHPSCSGGMGYQYIVGLRSDRLERRTETPVAAANRLPNTVKFSHVPHMKLVLETGSTFMGTRGRLVHVCSRAAAYFHGHTDASRKTAIKWMKDDQKPEAEQTFAADCGKKHRAKLQRHRPKADDACGWLQLMVMILACQPPDKEIRVLNMSVGNELFAYYLLDR